MKDYQLRVVEEKKELDEKIQKLAAFISSPEFAEVPRLHAQLLGKQVSTMISLSGTLTERINLFKEEELRENS